MGIEAKEKLIKFKKAYGPKTETRDTIQQLREYRKMLEWIKGGETNVFYKCRIFDVYQQHMDEGERETFLEGMLSWSGVCSWF